MDGQGYGGFRGFFVMWLGQLVSLVGSAMTRFALTIWAFEQTESATVLALVAFFAFGPSVLLSPVAGALVDRWNRKTIMIVSDLGAGFSTVLLLLLLTTGNLEVWHLYIVSALGSAFDAFQFPAFSAAVTMMVPRKHYGRASGMRSLAESASAIAAPVLAGLVLVAGGLQMVMLIDIVTFVFAVGALLVVYVPQPAHSAEGDAARGSLMQESGFGFRYILQRPSLLGMQMVFFFINLFAVFGAVLLAPMILSSTNNDEVALATVQAALGVGGLAGGLVMSAWGGPARRVHGVLIGMFLSGLLGHITIGVGQSLLWWSAGAFAGSFFIPILNGSNQAIWQSKVPPDLQGRVFAVRRLIAQITAPLAMLMAGPLADQVFEPGMMPGGALAESFGGLVGTGPGSGMALMFAISGVLMMLTGLITCAIPVIRNIETILPDYDPVPAPVTEPVVEVPATT